MPVKACDLGTPGHQPPQHTRTAPALDSFRRRSGNAAHDPFVSARVRLRLLVAALAAVVLAVLADVDRESGRPRLRPRTAASRPSVARPRSVSLGRSVEGRPIRATELGDPRALVALLLVGCIHGNEPAGIAVAKAVAAGEAGGAHVWVVDDLNPDG